MHGKKLFSVSTLPHIRATWSFQYFKGTERAYLATVLVRYSVL